MTYSGTRTDDNGQLDIESSFDLIEQPSKQRFSDEFYRRMFDRFPELRDKFTGVMLGHQGALLMSALGIIATNANRMRPSVAEYLKVLGHRHFQRGISVDDYEKFRLALLETLAAYLGVRWHTELEKEWQAALTTTIDMMVQGHREGPVVY
jgi:hemoglobin-like flavoprotein